MASMDLPASNAKQQKQQRRRWSVGRASTPRSHFSPRSSEAFYASSEPLSGRGGRALHNANGGGGGPDPDSNSAPDSCGAPETRNKQCRTSVRQSQDSQDRRGLAMSERELFHTVPRGFAISRKEILRRRCIKDETEEVFNSTEKDRSERPRTLPSMSRRTRQEAEHTSSLLKRVSRQDILRRRANAETNVQSKDVPRMSSSFQNFGRWTKEDRDLLPRPSTLPKILHTSKTTRLDEYGSSRTREAAGREAPIYGRIRRRKMSLPAGTAISRDSTTSSNTLTRISKTKTDGGRAETTKIVRYLRDPVPDPPDRSRNIKGDDIYAKVARKVSKQTIQDHEKLEPIDRTMSRRRILSNADQTDSLERRMHQDRDQDIVQIKHDAILVSKSDFERLRNFKVRKNDLENRNRSFRADSTWSKMTKDSRTDSWSHNKYPRADFTSTNERQVKCRSKSQSGLSMESRKENSKTGMKPTTLPSYVKIGQKTSTGLSARNAGGQKEASKTGPQMLTKQSKERSNYVRKTATRLPTHVRAFSDANSIRSSSPAASSSIFGFCTGKRKVQTSSTSNISPSWNVKMVRVYL